MPCRTPGMRRRNESKRIIDCTDYTDFTQMMDFIMTQMTDDKGIKVLCALFKVQCYEFHLS
jgi:hypothetical protein